MQQTYDQPQKNKVRERALGHAVEMLTKRRDQSCCARRSYVREVCAELLENGTEYDRHFAGRVKSTDIDQWEALHSSRIGKRKAADLTVCYLAGPQPENDLNVLLSLGVDPHNIWAFETDKNSYNAALASINSSSFPYLKIHKTTMESFFVTNPQTFDLVYFDACGPLPSTSQQTLRAIATLFRRQRLNSPGALITNFALPDTTVETTKINYAHLVASYLYPKNFIEGYPVASGGNAPEGPESYGLDPSEFLTKVQANLGPYYGQYITRQIFDLACVISPWLRLTNDGNWGQLFSGTTKDVLRLADVMRRLQSDDISLGSAAESYLDGMIIVEKGQFPINWTQTSLLGKPDPNFLASPSQGSKLYETWNREMSGDQVTSIDAKSAIGCFDVFRYDQRFWSERLKAAVGKYQYQNNMFQFCDVPTEELGFHLVANQLSYPMHYVTEACRRWTYIAKSTKMYTDCLMFDACRYLYDWLPTLDLLINGFNDQSRQLIYRFALDGLAKNRRWYNSEMFYGTAVLDQHSKPGFEAKYLTPRRKVL